MRAERKGRERERGKEREMGERETEREVRERGRKEREEGEQERGKRQEKTRKRGKWCGQYQPRRNDSKYQIHLSTGSSLPTTVPLHIVN